MSTAKEKAIELFNKFYQVAPYQEIEFYSNDVMARQCALKAVDEIINYLLDSDWALINNKAKYWEEVKQEILNL